MAARDTNFSDRTSQAPIATKIADPPQSEPKLEHLPKMAYLLAALLNIESG